MILWWNLGTPWNHKILSNKNLLSWTRIKQTGSIKLLLFMPPPCTMPRSPNSRPISSSFLIGRVKQFISLYSGIPSAPAYIAWTAPNSFFSRSSLLSLECLFSFPAPIWRFWAFGYRIYLAAWNSRLPSGDGAAGGRAQGLVTGRCPWLLQKGTLVPKRLKDFSLPPTNPQRLHMQRLYVHTR